MDGNEIKTSAEVAEMFGVSRSALRKHVRLGNVSPRRFATVTAWTRADIEQLKKHLRSQKKLLPLCPVADTFPSE